MDIQPLNPSNQSDVLGLLQIMLSQHYDVLPKNKRKNGFVTALAPPSFLRESGVRCFIMKKDFVEVGGYIIALPVHVETTNNIIETLKKQMVRNHLDRRDTVMIAQVCVADAHRKHGVAKALYAHTFATMKQIGYSVIVTEIDATNKASKCLHDSLGFKRVSAYRAQNRLFEIIRREL